MSRLLKISLKQLSLENKIHVPVNSHTLSENEAVPFIYQGEPKEGRNGLITNNNKKQIEVGGHPKNRHHNFLLTIIAYKLHYSIHISARINYKRNSLNDHITY